MGLGLASKAGDLEALLPAERARLVRLCARLTGDLDAAEDLAQETLIEAWRNAHKLHDPSGYSPWLSAIARNVCLRWGRRRGRELARLARPGQDGDDSSVGPDETLRDAFDLEVELERGELVDLLDRALALLPTDTREVLIDRYVRESPHAETAARLGLTEGAVAKRLERGRLILRRVLATELPHEAAAYGLLDGVDDWRETRIWCPECGSSRLLGRFAEHGQLQLDCTTCLSPRRAVIARYGSEPFAGGVKGFKPALNRRMAEAHQVHAGGVAGRVAPCVRCGAEAPFHAGTDEYTGGLYYIGAECGRCGEVMEHIALSFVALSTPEGRRFWREHGRIRALPSREIEASGTSAVVSGYESIADGARFEVVAARDTFRTLGIPTSSSEGAARVGARSEGTK